MSKNDEVKQKLLDPLVLVSLRNKFYRDSYRRLLFVLTVSFMMNIGLGSTLWYMMTHPPKPVYFATNLSGRVMPLFSLKEANRSDDSVINWGTNAAIAAFTYNYTNYRKEFQSASGFFTGKGWDNFLIALKDSNNLAAVTKKKLLVSAQLIKKARIVKRGTPKGRYSWLLKIPLLVTYQSTVQFTQQSVEVTMMVSRVSTLNAPSGIGIKIFVVRPLNKT